MNLEHIIKLLEDRQEELETSEEGEYLSGWEDGVQEVLTLIVHDLYNALEHLSKIH